MTQLANTLQEIADNGADAYYKNGKLKDDILMDLKDAGKVKQIKYNVVCLQKYFRRKIKKVVILLNSLNIEILPRISYQLAIYQLSIALCGLLYTATMCT